MALDPIEQAKTALRTQIRQRLNAMTQAARAEESAAVCAHALAWQPLAEASCVMAYVPMASEVDVLPLIRVLLGRGVTVCLPRVEWAASRLVPVPIRDLEQDLGERERGVRQPRADLAPLTQHRVQCVVVPGLAFDFHGGRLGQGGGFYDRWLAEQADTGEHRVSTLGVAYACQIVERVPREGHDRRMDAVVSPAGVLAEEHDGTQGTQGGCG